MMPGSHLVQFICDSEDIPQKNIQPASVDLRLGGQFAVYRGIAKGVLDLSKPFPERSMEVMDDADQLVIPSGGFALGVTRERIELPKNVVARVEGKSTLGRIGLMVHITAGFIDPGFEGNITLEFYNVSPYGLMLHRDMRICQVAAAKMEGIPPIWYGNNNTYQNSQGLRLPNTRRLTDG